MSIWEEKEQIEIMDENMCEKICKTNLDIVYINKDIVDMNKKCMKMKNDKKFSNIL